ncbi:MAG: glycoside hydrolase family 3 protein [Oscillospiraceae bacterium]|nr:glycoside hydrolase family 3 protein [Oscillospiraceae bacterium]
MAEHDFMNKSLDFDARTKALIDELTLDEKLLLITGHQGAIPRLGIKETYIGCEVARGLVCRGDFGEEPTTVFPEPFGLAATFDPSVMQSMGEVTGIETRIRNAQGKSSLFTWGPTVDAERHPLWGRNEEGYGEDPFLIGEMSSAFTRGMVGSDEKYYRVIPTLKHFYADNNEEDRSCDNACIPIALKHDYYLKAFEPAVKSGAKSLMTAYNEVNGVECVCNPEVDEICKKQWGLLFAVTDGGDFMQNVQYHKSDKNHTEAIARILTNHGADIMTDDEEVVRASAKAAVEQGLLKESDIDKAILWSA